jgi:hypothetical protein
VYVEDLPPDATNAADIAAALSGNMPNVVSITAITNKKLLFLLNAPPNGTKPPDLSPLKKQIHDAVSSLASSQSLVAKSTAAAKPSDATVYVATLAPGSRNASGIAAALTGLPRVISITAITDDKLVFVLDLSPKEGENHPQDAQKLEETIDNAIRALRSAKPSLASAVYVKTLPSRTGNASDIASRLTSVPGITNIISVGNAKLIFLLDQTPDPKTPNKPRDITRLQMQIDQLVDNLVLPYPDLYMVPFRLAAGKNCDIAIALTKQIPGVLNILPVSSTRLAFAIDPAMDSDDLRKLIDKYVDALAEPAVPNTDSYPVRLYYSHDLAALATIVHGAYPEVTAAPSSSGSTDTIVLSEALASTLGKRDPLQDARRMLALVDQPRPQLSLDAWSIQVSSTRGQDMQEVAPKIQSIAEQYNEVIASSSARGWGYLTGLLQTPNYANYVDPDFANYLTFTTYSNDICCETTSVQDEYRNGRPGYSLGYASLFKPLRTNLVYWLVALAAGRKPLESANSLLDVMEGGPNKATTGDCQRRDKEAYPSDPAVGPEYLQLECVREVLKTRLFALRSPSLGIFRAAIADFLFHYKMSNEYPHEFEPFLFAKSAALLDSQLSPVADAFTSDLEVFQNKIDLLIANLPAFTQKHVTYAASGIVTVKVVAGNPASVQTQTQNYFDATPPTTLGDYAAAIKSIGTPSSTTGKLSLPNLLTSNMTANEAVASLAAIQALSSTPTKARIGKGLTLSATAYSLSGAAGAEMDISVESNENGAELVTASTVSNPASQVVQSDDLASRVSDHKVSSRVRVNSLKFFELSTMQSVLARGRAPWMPVDPWLEIPVLNYLVRVPRKPDLSFHRSFIFINALIVPTAIDLGNGVPYVPDVTGSGMSFVSTHRLEALGGDQVEGRIREYNRRMLDYFMSGIPTENGIRYPRDAPSFLDTLSIQ